MGTLIVNLVLAALLYRGKADNLNLRAAYLHILSDVLGSFAAVLTGLLVKWKGWRFADPLLTLIITVLLLAFAWRLTRQTLHILLEGAPAHVDPADVEASLRRIEGVRDVHDLHLWTLTSGADFLTAHLVLEETPKDDAISHQVHASMAERYGIDHVTVQVESPSCPCTMRQHVWRGNPAL
jgi:cobalt-zinc-cadmium efflux system protein